MTPSPKLTAMLVGVLSLLLAGTAHAAEPVNHPYLPQFSFDGEATPGGAFADACGVAEAPGGPVYVSDYYDHAIDVFTPAATYLWQLAGLDPLDGPCGLAFSSSGELYVNDYHRDVRRFGISEIPSGPGTVIDAGHPTGVAVDASGNVYVDDRTYVAEYEPSGAPVMVGGEPVRIGLGRLGDGYGVAVSDFPATSGDVYVADAATDTIEVFDPAVSLAAPVGTIDGAGTPQQGFRSLVDASLAVDPASGHLFVVDDTQPGFEHPAAVVDEFNAEGDYRGQLPHALVDGEPSGLALNVSGDIYVTSGNGEGASVLAFGPGIAGHVLRVSVTGSGAGTVRSEPAGIACGTACTAEFDAGGEVTLTAAPEAGSIFAGWTGCVTQSAYECTLTMSSDRSVSAEFVSAPPAPAEPRTGIAERAGAAGLALSSGPRRASAGRSGASASEVVQKGTLRVAFSGKLAPTSLPRRGVAPVGVTIGGRITTTDASDPPQLRKIAIAMNRDGQLDYKGLPACTLREIQPSTTETALATCGDAKIGEGTFSANVKLPQQSPFPSQGRLVAFNGFEHGHPVILAHVYGTEPVPTSLTIPLKATQSKGQFGTTLSGFLPTVTSKVGFITGIQMTLKRSFQYRGRRHSYLSAGCPAPKGFPGVSFPLARASFSFAGSQTLTETLERSCRAR